MWSPEARLFFFEYYVARGQGHTAKSAHQAMSRFGTASGGPAIKNAGPSRIRNTAAGDMFEPTQRYLHARAKARGRRGNIAQLALQGTWTELETFTYAEREKGTRGAKSFIKQLYN